MFPETNKRSLNLMAWEYGPTAPGASTTGFVRPAGGKGRSLPEVKTGVKAGSVVIVEDIVLLKDGLSVRRVIGLIRRTKPDEIHNDGIVNMVVFGRQTCP